MRYVLHIVNDFAYEHAQLRENLVHCINASLQLFQLYHYFDVFLLRYMCCKLWEVKTLITFRSSIIWGLLLLGVITLVVTCAFRELKMWWALQFKSVLLPCGFMSSSWLDFGFLFLCTREFTRTCEGISGWSDQITLMWVSLQRSFPPAVSLSDAIFGQRWRLQKWNKGQRFSWPVTGGTGINGLRVYMPVF